MNINSRNINIIYLFLYFSLLVGFYFNEDFAFGYRTDYSLYHHSIVSLLKEDFLNTLLNFDKFLMSHSPIYYIFFFIFRKNFI